MKMVLNRFIYIFVNVDNLTFDFLFYFDYNKGIEIIKI